MSRVIWVGSAPPVEITDAAPDVVHVPTGRPREVIADEVLEADARAP